MAIEFGLYHINLPKSLTLAKLKGEMNKMRLREELLPKSLSSLIVWGDSKRNSSNLIETNFAKFLRKF